MLLGLVHTTYLMSYPRSPSHTALVTLSVLNTQVMGFWIRHCLANNITSQITTYKGSSLLPSGIY